MHPHQPPFQYSKPYVPFDWKELYGLNLENALARNDFRVFGTVASSLAFGDIETPFRQGGVPEDVVRLASVQQYLAQYLLHMQDVLMYEIELARANPPPSPDIQALLAERDALRKQLRIERAKRQTDAMMLRLASVNPETVNMLFRCHVCGKVFADYHFLVSHYEKRHEGIHPIQPPPFKPPPASQQNHCCKLHMLPQAVVEAQPSQQPQPAQQAVRSLQTSLVPDNPKPEEPPSDIFADYVSDVA
ncbi:Zinc finger domain protein [Giardia lamblia P15]|uniref:Zinc finger domain protein n=1 Tax=Giardia intestinalis (strain P15) TaxID=658858 RepID=E1F602_GIAIA|nr:Zinc finger domain protein [Giardia lamblia P15]